MRRASRCTSPGLGISSTEQRVALASVASIVVGLLVSAQSRINASLTQALASTGDSETAASFHAATISFGTGLALLLLGLVAWPRMRRGMAAVAAALREHRLRWWQVLGGMGGAWLVATQGLTVPTLGVALFLVSVVAGQTFGSLVVDSIGLGPAGRIAVTPVRLAAAGLALGAVALVVAPRLTTSLAPAPTTLLLALIAGSAGLAVSAQQAVNGQVSVAAGWAIPAAVMNFLVGFSTLALISVLGGWIADWSWGDLPTQAGLYVGGPIGVAFIAIAAWVVPLVGVLRFALAAIAGQLVGGAALDLLAPQPGIVLGWELWAGLVLTLLAVILANRR